MHAPSTDTVAVVHVVGHVTIATAHIVDGAHDQCPPRAERGIALYIHNHIALYIHNHYKQLLTIGYNADLVPVITFE